nr:hypothetical protein [Tanacetum cinerariifolium]
MFRGHSEPKELPVFESYIVEAEEDSAATHHLALYPLLKPQAAFGKGHRRSTTGRPPSPPAATRPHRPFTTTAPSTAVNRSPPRSIPPRTAATHHLALYPLLKPQAAFGKGHRRSTTGRPPIPVCKENKLSPYAEKKIKWWAWLLLGIGSFAPLASCYIIDKKLHIRATVLRGSSHCHSGDAHHLQTTLFMRAKFNT